MLARDGSSSSEFMRLTVHEEAAGFLAAAGSFLRAAENSSITTQAARMIEAPREDDSACYFATVTDGEPLVAAALYGSSGGVVLTAAPDAAVALFAADLAARGRRLRHIVGPLQACEAFARTWREHTGNAHRLRYHLRHFELTQAPSPPYPAAGSMRLPMSDEQTLILDWCMAFFEEVGLSEEPVQLRPREQQRLDRGQFRVWDDGGAVSCAAYGEAGDTGRIAPVYTPPAFRGCGYASAVVTDLSRELFERGKRAIFLTTDVANPTSNSIYRKIGYRPVADHFHFDLAGSK